MTMELIEKAAIVAEIEKRIDELYNMLPDTSKVEDGIITISEACNTGKYTALESFKDYLDTLEVKEVDLENSVNGRIDYPLIGVDFPNIYPNYKELKDYCDRNSIKDEDKVKIIIIKDNII